MILAMGMEHVEIFTVDTVARVTMDTKGHHVVKVCDSILIFNTKHMHDVLLA